MTRGKPWSFEEEKLLRSLVDEGKGFTEISQIMGKPRLATKSKMSNLGLTLLKVAATDGGNRVAATAAATSRVLVSGVVPVQAENLLLPEELPSIEEKLKSLSAALSALEQPGLDRNTVMRFRTLINGVEKYQQLFAMYVNYRGLEIEVVELRKKIASFENARGSESS